MSENGTRVTRYQEAIYLSGLKSRLLIPRVQEYFNRERSLIVFPYIRVPAAFAFVTCTSTMPDVMYRNPAD